jgi:hypothetical protein
VERELEPNGSLGAVTVGGPVSAASGSPNEYALGFRDLTVLAAMVDAARSAINEKARMEKILNVARLAYPKLDFRAEWPNPVGLDSETKYILGELTAALRRLS